MVKNRAEDVAAEIGNIAKKFGLDDATVAAGIQLFIADDALTAEATGQARAEVVIDQLSASIKGLANIRRPLERRLL